MTSLCLALLLFTAEADPKKADPPDAKATTPDAAPKPPAKKSSLLKKKGEDPAAKKKDDDKKPKDDEAPVVENRPIPAPDMKKDEPSDLDKELLDDLGKKLEKAEDNEDPLERASQRMRSSEERLAQLDGSDDTLELQRKIVADLEEILQQQQNNSNNNQQQKQQKQKKNQKQDEKQKKQQQQQQQQQKKSTAGKSSEPAESASKGSPQKEQTGQTRERKDIWGHLSAMMRQEMNQQAKESFLPKYREMLERYYTNIAENSGSKSE